MGDFIAPSPSARHDYASCAAGTPSSRSFVRMLPQQCSGLPGSIRGDTSDPRRAPFASGYAASAELGHIHRHGSYVHGNLPAHSSGTLMDLVHPALGQPFKQFWTNNMAPAEQSMTHRPMPQHPKACSSSTPSVVCKRQPPTMLVGELGEWKKRRAPCMCHHAECPGLSSQQGLAYIAVKLVKVGNSVERYFDFRTKRELHLGKQLMEQKVGLRLSQSATAALSVLGQPSLRRHDIVVLRGVASGMGCRHGQVIYAPMFRPVCAMDYIVTNF
eukprot:jgi/Ulvmu1/2594/UM014_0045.1